jgi:hypothetical protein
MKKTYLIAFVCLFAVFCSQCTQAQTVLLPGYAVLKDGTRINGTIELYENAPWYNQRFIYLTDSASIAASANGKGKSKKYVADDLKFYQAGGRQFQNVHYVDYENLQLKSMGSNDHMLEVVASGKINAYKFYQYPKDLIVSFGSDQDVRDQIAREKNDLIAGYKMLSRKDGDNKLRDAFDYDLQKYFEDTPEVLEKYKTGGYGNEPVNVKKGLAAKMMSMARKTAFKPQQADAYILAFADYNQKNAVAK